MKRIMSFTLVILILFAFCACSNNNSVPAYEMPDATPTQGYSDFSTFPVVESLGELTTENWTACISRFFNIDIVLPNDMAVNTARRVNGTVDDFTIAEITFTADDIMTSGAGFCEYMFGLTEKNSTDGNYPADFSSDTGKLICGETKESYSDCTSTVNKNYFQAKWSYTHSEYSNIVYRIMIDVENVYSLITLRISVLGNK